MQRVALVGTIKQGKESDLWRAQDQLTSGNFGGGNLPGFETFIGSGFFVMVLDAPVQDFQNRFRDMFNSGPLQNFLHTVQSCVEGFPSGQYLTGDQERQQQGGNGGNGGFSSADLPMAALAAQFIPGQGLKTFGEMNNSGTGTGSRGGMAHSSAGGSSGQMPRGGSDYTSGGSMHGTSGNRSGETMQTPPITGPGQVGTGQSGRG